MEFWVGVNERHLVGFYFDKFWGKVRINVDQNLFEQDWRVFWLSPTYQREFDVGVYEKHRVQFSKVGPLAVQSDQPQRMQALVDGELVVQWDIQ